MTKNKNFIYFIRHAESLYVEGAERSRGLTDNGKLDAIVVKELLINEGIDLFYSSPYSRTINTIMVLANELSKEIIIEEDLREREIGDFSKCHFKEAKRKVYEDFRFSFTNGESSEQAQRRAVKVVEKILEEHDDKRIVIGTHGDIMSLMLNYFDKNYGFSFWESTSMPDIYQLYFEGLELKRVIRLWK
ncbi:histidine phosphatase family protein [Paenibacillus sediminis]|uniref:2,3-bisphosphoglycerate-dependent phosphoglycerate mutase n=1 Tax=Paenibacillus sediminis TaxID=664909 RepID=A0ABS4H1Z1_9BACL|nr:histidine phosphatase family protein [Paenibacillus sediminis]MBP1936543.1 2,3-bisphosphoglycerate-dependent phosphoglycerate mutase [Paenibacillus sediminis]